MVSSWPSGAGRGSWEWGGILGLPPGNSTFPPGWFLLWAELLNQMGIMRLAELAEWWGGVISQGSEEAV